ncbi:MAG: HAMP domain-containing histidine kinase [Oscillospiraceae bacterium]|nr:HAMP domain-containing histidine kinase [Oscillospiraceae bacterium]
MKKYLITAAIAFIALLAVATALLCSASEKPPEVDFGSYTVAANEIEQLIANGDTATAQIRAAELKTELSKYVPESNNSTAYLWMIFAACSALIIAVFLYIWFTVLRPFEKLTGFAERIANGDFDLPLNYERTNYFGKFTWAFDCMRREISSARACEKEAIENNKTVIASLSHDIKTPVASIRAYAEGLEAGMDATPEKRAKYLSVIMRKCDEVAALTNDMLLHSISDLDKLKMNPTEFELCGFIKEAVSEISARNNIHLNLPAYFIDINADRNRLTQVFENIVSNAAKYAKTDVEISAAKTDKGAEITFRDFGKGIPDEEIPFIFDKFYRGNRIEKENGAGLGLYIVKYVVTQLGGEVYAENLPDGFQIKIILPEKADG